MFLSAPKVGQMPGKQKVEKRKTCEHDEELQLGTEKKQILDPNKTYEISKRTREFKPQWQKEFGWLG